jgi:hypothetical protein
MYIQTKTYNTLPTKKDSWWQIVLLPTVSILNSINKNDPYVAVNVEWLFWSYTTIISHGKSTKNPYILEG